MLLSGLKNKMICCSITGLLVCVEVLWWLHFLVILQLYYNFNNNFFLEYIFVYYDFLYFLWTELWVSVKKNILNCFQESRKKWVTMWVRTRPFQVQNVRKLVCWLELKSLCLDVIILLLWQYLQSPSWLRIKTTIAASSFSSNNVKPCTLHTATIRTCLPTEQFSVKAHFLFVSLVPTLSQTKCSAIIDLGWHNCRNVQSSYSLPYQAVLHM